jgi:CubicO group peptidase (beta-lactamase class C family)
MKRFRTSAAALAISAAMIQGSSIAQAGQAETEGWRTPTMIDARAHMFHTELSFLTFQHLDKMFASRTVEASGEVWELPVELTEIEGEFDLEGEKVSFDEFLEGSRTSGLLVIRDGKIVAEHYRNNMDENTRHIAYSMSKSIVATLIGIALAEGKIASIDDKVTDYLPEMEGSGYDDVTIRDVLRMRSGVAWEERYEFGSDTQLTQVHDNALVLYNYRWCDYASDRSERAGEPGAEFNYATLDTSVLGCILEKAVGMTGSEYMSEKIWKPAGMQADGYWIMDGPEGEGREFYGAGFNATLRDFGRFGLMMLQNGEANGKQIVPADWVAESTIADEGYEPTEEGAPFGYQYQWWTLPGSDAYAALGLHDQFIYIDPPSNTVIVKLSHSLHPLGLSADTIAFFEQVTDSLAQ